MFMGTLAIFFYTSDYLQGFAAMMGTTNVFAFIIAFVGLQGLLEIILAAVVGALVPIIKRPAASDFHYPNKIARKKEVSAVGASFLVSTGLVRPQARSPHRPRPLRGEVPGLRPGGLRPPSAAQFYS